MSGSSRFQSLREVMDVPARLRVDTNPLAARTFSASRMACRLTPYRAASSASRGKVCAFVDLRRKRSGGRSRGRPGHAARGTGRARRQSRRFASGPSISTSRTRRGDGPRPLRSAGRWPRLRRYRPTARRPSPLAPRRDRAGRSPHRLARGCRRSGDTRLVTVLCRPKLACRSGAMIVLIRSISELPLAAKTATWNARSAA